MATERPGRQIRITPEPRTPIQIATIVDCNNTFPELKDLLADEKRTSAITTLDLLRAIMPYPDAIEALGNNAIDVEKLQLRLKDPNLRMLAANHEETGFTRRAFEIINLANKKALQEETAILPKYIAQYMTQGGAGGIGPSLINFYTKTLTHISTPSETF